MNTQPLTDFKLLSLCAILRAFDLDMLLSLTDCNEDVINTLLSGAYVEPIATFNGLYRLRQDVVTKVLEQLRTDLLFDNLALHAKICDYFRNRMQRTINTDQRLLIEDECFHHLDRIFILANAHMEWHTVLKYTNGVRSALPQDPRHLQQLTLYEGFVYIRTQEYERGIEILTTLKMQKEIAPNIRLSVLQGLAQGYLFQSQYDRALHIYSELYSFAIDIRNHAYQGLALLNMGHVYHEIGNYEQALRLRLQSLPIFREHGEHSREAYALYLIGVDALHLGRWRFAQEYFDQAVPLFESLRLDAGLAALYWSRGFLFQLQGAEEQSELAYVQAFPLATSEEHGQPSVAMDVMLYLGLLYQTQERWTLALEHYGKALQFANQLRAEHQIALIHFRRAQALQRLGHIVDAFAAYQQAIDGIEALGGATEGEDIKISLFGTTQQLYEAIVLLLLDLGRPADAFHYMERARSRAFLDTLVKKSPELYDALAQPVATLADVQARLPAGALLLEYFTTGVLPSGEHMLNSIPESNARLRQHLTLPPQVIVFAITRDRCEIYRPSLNPNSLRPPVGDRYPGRHLLHGRLPQSLYDRLIAPAAALLDSCTTLYLVPHGPLHYLPFTALRSAAGEYLLHANGPALAQAPSATILLRNCIGRPPARGASALAIGFNDPQGDQPLRYAEAEAEHVARILGGAAWTGMEPKSERLIAAGRGVRWLHIAGHARFNPADPLGSELFLGPGDRLSARAIIRDLDLAADLVTLSSCTSGVSHVVPGDELLGLQRALLYAGAPAVLCTRWEARDLVSLLVMDHFYTALQQGQAPSIALRDAQIAVRELTSQELAAQLERWDARGTLTLASPAEALRDAQSATRELASLDLGALRDAWRGEAPDLAAALDQPAVQPSTLEARPFADPLFWAPFMMVGRA